MSCKIVQVLILVIACITASAGVNAKDSDLDIALSLADMLRASRTVIANNQSLINDPDKTDKALTGDEVVNQIMSLLAQENTITAEQLAEDTRLGRYLRYQSESIAEVIDENQTLINRPGLAFKGFVPAVFARLVNERFSKKAAGEANVKVTAPLDLIRNRRARPDAWELDVFESQFRSADWKRGERYTASTEIHGREAFRVMVPEYYGDACLACHGAPKAELDVTGYPKEGASTGQLAGAVSITIFK